MQWERHDGVRHQAFEGGFYLPWEVFCESVRISPERLGVWSNGLQLYVLARTQQGFRAANSQHGREKR